MTWGPEKLATPWTKRGPKIRSKSLTGKWRIFKSSISLETQHQNLHHLFKYVVHCFSYQVPFHLTSICTGVQTCTEAFQSSLSATQVRPVRIGWSSGLDDFFGKNQLENHWAFPKWAVGLHFLKSISGRSKKSSCHLWPFEGRNKCHVAGICQVWVSNMVQNKKSIWLSVSPSVNDTVGWCFFFSYGPTFSRFIISKLLKNTNLWTTSVCYHVPRHCLKTLKDATDNYI